MREAPAKPGAPSDHYSYAFYADPAHAGRFDRLRFGGPIGALVADEQARVVEAFLPDVSGCEILDVGTGTGRAALGLARRGARVTGIDASEQMLAIARQRAIEVGLSIDWRRGDAHRLEFESGSFDAAISLRVLMHAPGWRTCLAELCRVARDRVLFDYPAAFSAAALQAVTRRLGARLGARTEAYRVFTDRVIEGELARHGFRVAAVHRQFVLPIALYKVIGSTRFTRLSERALRGAGLLRLFGSPVTLVATRARRD